MCVRVRACVRACVRARARVRACVRAWVNAYVRACVWVGRPHTHTHTHTRMHARIYSRSLQGELHHDTNTLAEKGLSECHCVQSGYRHRWKSTMSKPLCVFMKYSGLGPMTLPAVDLPLWRQTAAPRKKWLSHRKICPSSLTKNNNLELFSPFCASGSLRII